MLLPQVTNNHHRFLKKGQETDKQAQINLCSANYLWLLVDKMVLQIKINPADSGSQASLCPTCTFTSLIKQPMSDLEYWSKIQQLLIFLDQKIRYSLTSSQDWQVRASFTLAFSIWTSSSSFSPSSGFLSTLGFDLEEILWRFKESHPGFKISTILNHFDMNTHSVSFFSWINVIFYKKKCTEAPCNLSYDLKSDHHLQNWSFFIVLPP